MNQSILATIPPAWNLATINAYLSSCVDLKSLKISLFEEQIEVQRDDETCVIVECIPDDDDQTSNSYREELMSDPHLDERFRRDVPTMGLFVIDYKDFHIARHVLRCLMEAIVATGNESWTDTPGGMSARDFLAKMTEDPNWDWREY